MEVVAYANPVGGADALTALENLVESVRGALFASGLAPGDTDQPTVDAEANALSARTPITIRTTCH